MDIKSVFRLDNDMVLVFDAEGEQVSQYQGQYEDVKEGILRDAAADAIFAHWFDSSAEPSNVPRENW